MEVVDFPWLGEAAGGQLEEGFTDFSGLVGLEDEDDEDFFTSDFSDFFSAGPLKPEVVWPSTTPTTDTSAGSTTVELRVSELRSLTGVEDLASLFSYLSL